MAVSHAEPGQVIRVWPLQDNAADAKTQTLLKTNAMEVLRLVLPKGKKIAEHKAPDEITVHCLEGKILFSAGGKEQTLVAGEMLFVNAAEPHALEAIEASAVLVTLLLKKKE